jgi:hypothetical protein
VTLRAVHFSNLNQASAAETAAVLDRELPGVTVTAAADQSIVFSADVSGATSSIVFPASTLRTKLGLPAVASVGAAAVAAKLGSAKAEPFALANGDTLVINVDGDVPRTVQFSAADTTAAQLADAINRVLPGVAVAFAGTLQIVSPNPGERSLVAINVQQSAAAPKLGFGAPAPPVVKDVNNTEPSAFEDAAGNVWLFSSSSRSGVWKIWYTRFDGVAWATPKTLTAGVLPDREPFAVFDASAGGRIWVFWTRRKANGLRNIFFRTTAKLDFSTLVDADWTEYELTPVPTTYDNREPAAIVASPGNISLFFASNRTDGWNVWTKPLTTATQGADTAATTGQVTRRAPAPLLAAGGVVRLFFRSNESVEYKSSFYPTSITIDARYGGSITADTRNAARLSMRGNYRDISRYTYDTPKTSPANEEKRVYSRDTVGVFLSPDTADQQLILRNRGMIASALKPFLPIQVRAVLVIDQVYREDVYTYEQTNPAAPVGIDERFADRIFSADAAVLDNPRDRVDFKSIRIFPAQRLPSARPDAAVPSPGLSFRRPPSGINEAPP